MGFRRRIGGSDAPKSHHRLLRNHGYRENRGAFPSLGRENRARGIGASHKRAFGRKGLRAGLRTFAKREFRSRVRTEKSPVNRRIARILGKSKKAGLFCSFLGQETAPTKLRSFWALK